MSLRFDITASGGSAGRTTFSAEGERVIFFGADTSEVTSPGLIHRFYLPLSELAINAWSAIDSEIADVLAVITQFNVNTVSGTVGHCTALELGVTYSDDRTLPIHPFADDYTLRIDRTLPEGALPANLSLFTPVTLPVYLPGSGSGGGVMNWGFLRYGARTSDSSFLIEGSANGYLMRKGKPGNTYPHGTWP